MTAGGGTSVGAGAAQACAFLWDAEADLGQRGRAVCEQADAVEGIAIDEPGVHRACIAAGDLDGDGLLDAAVGVGDARCGAVDDAACRGWGAGADAARQGHDAAMAAIQSTR